VAIDTSMLLWMSVRRLPEAATHVWRSVRISAVLLAILLIAGLLPSLGARIVFVGAVLLVFAAIGWLQILRSEERSALLRMSPLSS